MGTVSPRVAARVAWAAAALNLLAAVAMLGVLRPGLPEPGNDADSRLRWISGHTAAWWAGWLLWHAAAISLLALYVSLAGIWRERAPVRCGLALLLAAAGLAGDLGAEALLMGVAPGAGPEDFRVVEAACWVLTGYLGNGLYTLAGILLTWAGVRELPRPLVALGGAAWAAGLALSAATLAGSQAGQFWSTAFLMPLFVLWAALVGRWLARRPS
ncbi:MAG: hypothetical protein L0216_10380 [Planctomycetales bacterium]|nr:hypothetical protein [Planctomycetales bacterium]